MIARMRSAAIGGCAVAVAWIARGSVVGAVVWSLALAISCLGYGVAVERLTGQRARLASTATTGLATLLIGSVALAHLGWLRAGVQLVAVIAGIAGTALLARPRVHPADPGEQRADHWWFAVLGTLCIAVLIAVEIAAPSAAGTGDASDALAIQQLWQLGAFPSRPHERGLQLVGEAYAAWTTGADAGGLFGVGVCAALALALVASECRSERAAARLLFACVAVAAVWKEFSPVVWPAALLQLGASVVLRDHSGRRTCWHALLPALALGLWRDECWLIAAPYAVAAVALPRVEQPSRRALALGVVGWWFVAFALALVTGSPLVRALRSALILLLAAPLALAARFVVSATGWRSAVAVACAAMVSYELGLASYLVLPAAHTGDATSGAWLGFGLALVILAGDARQPWPGRDVRVGAALVVIAGFAAIATLQPFLRPFDVRRGLARALAAIESLHARMVLGPDRAAADVHAAQLRVAPGDPIAFWGWSAGLLDVRRNPIRALAPTSGYLPIAPAELRGGEWLIVEGGATDVRDPWLPMGERVPVIARVADRLELVAGIGSARLYRAGPL